MNNLTIGLLLFFICLGLLFITDVPTQLFQGSKDSAQLIIASAKKQYHDAVIEHIDTVYSESNTKVRLYVLRNLNTICPERLMLTYIYPKNQFSPEIEEITTGCKICKSQKCVIAYPEEAVIASYIYNAEVRYFIEKAKNPAYYVSQNPKSDIDYLITWKDIDDSYITASVSKNALVVVINKSLSS